MRHAALPIALFTVGCTAQPVAIPTEAAAPYACEVSTTASGAGASELASSATPLGATVAWVAGDGVHALRLGKDGHPAAPPVLAWPGRYDRVTVAGVDDQVIVGAVAGQTTWVLGAPFGLAPYRELALLGGMTGASPMVVAGGQRVAATVSYGGLLVSSFDTIWAPHTSELAVLTARSTDVAASAVGKEAVVAWSTTDACFIELVVDASNGTGWAEPGACASPRLAAIGGEAVLVFERDGGIFAARGGTLHPASAVRIASGHAPRLIAHDGLYWVTYLDDTGSVVAGVLGEAGLDSVTLGPALAQDLVVIGGVPRVVASDAAGLSTTALCR